jgi:hypothetical protein
MLNSRAAFGNVAVHANPCCSSEVCLTLWHYAGGTCQSLWAPGKNKPGNPFPNQLAVHIVRKACTRIEQVTICGHQPQAKP